LERLHRRFVFQQRLVMDFAVLVFDEVPQVRGDQWPAARLEFLEEVIPPLEPAELRLRAAAELEVTVLLAGEHERDVRLLAGRPAAELLIEDRMASGRAAAAGGRLGVRFGRTVGPQPARGDDAADDEQGKGSGDHAPSPRRES